VWVTAQAVAALARKTLPLKRVPRAKRTTAAVTPAATPAATATATATPAAAKVKQRRVQVQSLPPVGTPVPSTPPALVAAAEVPAAGLLLAALM
jgi:hypothetical protein